MGMLEAITLSVIAASTPLLLAAAGELVGERSGGLNLGLAGMMILGPACGFGAAWVTGSTLVGALAGTLAGATLALVFALLTLGLAVNQVATGLALTILGTGLSGLIGAGFVGQRIEQAPALYLPVLTELPVVGRILFGQDAFVYGSIALLLGIRRFPYRRPPGLALPALAARPPCPCARPGPPRPRPMRAAIRPCGGGCPRRCSAAPAPGSPAPPCRSPTRRSSSPA